MQVQNLPSIAQKAFNIYLEQAERPTRPIGIDFVKFTNFLDVCCALDFKITFSDVEELMIEGTFEEKLPADFKLLIQAVVTMHTIENTTTYKYGRSRYFAHRLRNQFLRLKKANEAKNIQEISFSVRAIHQIGVRARKYPMLVEVAIEILSHAIVNDSALKSEIEDKLAQLLYILKAQPD